LGPGPLNLGDKSTVRKKREKNYKIRIKEINNNLNESRKWENDDNSIDKNMNWKIDIQTKNFETKK
jgi:hypothetical protein